MEERGHHAHHHHAHHENGKNPHKILLITIIAIVIIVGVLLAVYLLKSTDVSDNGLPGTDTGIDCELMIAGSGMGLSSGIIMRIPVSGYKESLDQVVWRTENPNVAVVNPVSGVNARLQAVGPGTTTITATDTAVGPSCTSSIIVNVI